MHHLNPNINSLAIGSFDGIHIAHKELIEQSDGLVAIERSRGYLTPGYLRGYFVKKPIFLYMFEKISSLDPSEFVQMLQSHFCNLQNIVVGYDFSFGRGASGDVQTLKSTFEHKVTVVDEIKIDGISVHSRVIKEYIQSAKFKMATRLLGREYTTYAKRIKGAGQGSKELVATINLDTQEFVLPKDGTYATRTKVKDKWYDSVTFVGKKDSVGLGFCVETHLIGVEISVDLCEEVEVVWVEHIRSNIVFKDLRMLKNQIELDIQKTAEILKNAKNI